MILFKMDLAFLIYNLKNVISSGPSRKVGSKENKVGQEKKGELEIFMKILLPMEQNDK